MSRPPPELASQFASAPLAELALCLIARPLSTREIHWRFLEAGMAWGMDHTTRYLQHLCGLHLIAPSTPTTVERLLACDTAFVRRCGDRPQDAFHGLDRYVVIVRANRPASDEWSISS